MTETGKRGLAAKMVAVMAELENVPKTGRNAFHGYSFVEENALVERVQRALVRNGVAFYASVVALDQVDVRGRVRGEDAVTEVTRATVEYTFVDADTNEERTIQGMGYGLDSQDKGPYKAITGATKYALMKSLLVPTGDDPEHDRGHPDPRAAPESQGKAADAVSPEQAKRLRGLAQRLAAATGEPVDAAPPRSGKEAEKLASDLEAAIAVATQGAKA